jgi:hypothetical protein
MTIVPCEEATFLISKRQDTALTVRERYALIVHLIVCKYCRRFLEQTRLLLTAVKELRSDERLTHDEKRKLQELLGST